MKSSIATILATAVFAALPTSTEAQSTRATMSPVTATLTIPDRKTLPGVPFDMWIDVNNGSDATVGVGMCATMVVRRDNGEPFEIVPQKAGGGGPDYPVLLTEPGVDTPVRYLLMRPHQRETLPLPIGDHLSGPEYFDDARLSGPGRYTIALRLDYCWQASTPQAGKETVTFLGPVITNEVTIERTTPTGKDAAVWQRMQELTNGQWRSIQWAQTNIPSNTVSKEIRAKYRDSNYWPYLLLAEWTQRDTQADLLDAAKRFPDTPVFELLHRMAAISFGPEMVSESAKLKNLLKRPTTRIQAFGREGEVAPCRPDATCTEP